MLAELTFAALHHPFRRYFLANCPAFLTVTLFAILIGLSTVPSTGLAIDTLAAVVTVLFALVAHAGINVLNDYDDALIGTDDIYIEFEYPFTGCSRFIQDRALWRGAPRICSGSFAAGRTPTTRRARWRQPDGKRSPPHGCPGVMLAEAIAATRPA